MYVTFVIGIFRAKRTFPSDPYPSDHQSQIGLSGAQMVHLGNVEEPGHVLTYLLNRVLPKCDEEAFCLFFLTNGIPNFNYLNVLKIEFGLSFNIIALRKLLCQVD